MKVKGPLVEKTKTTQFSWLAHMKRIADNKQTTDEVGLREWIPTGQIKT